MNDSLNEFVRSVLLEITRYEKETGKKYDVVESIKKLVSKSHPVKYAFTMTLIPKVGINPMTSFDTPAGVYAYQLNLSYFRRLLDNTLPFASDRPYCNIMKLNFGAGKWLITSKNGLDTATDADVEAVKQKVGSKVSTTAEKLGKHWNMGNACKIYDLTYFATKELPRSTVAWARLLRDLGYIGVYDPGNSVLHPSEPMQLVCLNASAYTWMNTYETREIRKKEQKDIDYDHDEAKWTKQKVKDWVEKWQTTELVTFDADLENEQRALEIVRGFLPADTDTLTMAFEKSASSEKYDDIVRNPNATQELLQKTIDVKLPIILEKLDNGLWWSNVSLFDAIYLHPNCPPSFWNNLEDFIRSELSSAVWMSPNVPTDVLMKCFNKITHGKKINDAMAETNSVYHQKNLVAMLRNPKMPPDILEQALDSKREDVSYAAMYNPNIPQRRYDALLQKLKDPNVSDIDKKPILYRLNLKPNDAIKILNTSKDEEANRIILRRTQFSPETLDALAGKFSANREYLRNIIINPQTSKKTIRKLAQHPNSTVRASALDQLKTFRKTT